MAFARMVTRRIRKVFAWVVAIGIIGLVIAGTFFIVTNL